MKGRRLLATIIVTVLLVHIGLGCGSKDDNRDNANAATAAAGVATAIDGGLGNAIAIGLGIYQVVTLLGLSHSDEDAVAVQFPDPQFGTIVSTVTPVQFNAVPVDIDRPKPFEDINASLKVAGALIDNARLLRITLRRYYGALKAGDSSKAELQRAFACSLVSKLDVSIQSYSGLLAAISSDLQGTQVGSLSVKASDVLALRDQIVATGTFPDFEQSVLTQAQFSYEETQEAIRQVALVNGNTLSNTGITAVAIFAKAAKELDQFSVQVFLPKDFSCAGPVPSSVPTLSEWGMIIMALLLLVAGTIFIVRRQPLIAEAATVGDIQLNNRNNRSLFVPASFTKTLVSVSAVALIGLLIVRWLSGPISATDIGGTLLCAMIFGYLVHLLILATRNSQ